MKVIHVPFSFFPDPVGGTEIYVDGLCRHLRELGVESVIAAPGETTASYRHHGLRVRRYTVVQDEDDLADLYGEGNARAAREFGRVLDEERPDVAHLHAFTSGVSLRVLREARGRQVPVVFTYHTPTASCQRGTLLRWGREVCDGRLDLRTCARCTLDGHGLGRGAAWAVGSLPPVVGRLVGAAGLSGRLCTALRMTDLIRSRHAAFRALVTEVDGVVALCQWTKALLLRNGVPERKIVVSTHGLAESSAEGDQAEGPLPRETPLRVAYLGRLDPTKGPDTLVRALRSLPDASIELHFYGVVQGVAGRAYLGELKALASGDPRIAFWPAVASDRIVSLLRGYHVLAVPSRWLETGPLVVLEAFAAGIPVVGSNLGGIAELIRHGVDGLLVEPGSPEAWREALRRLASDHAGLARLKAGVRPPRRMAKVADEMAALYARVARPRSPKSAVQDPHAHVPT